MMQAQAGFPAGPSVQRPGMHGGMLGGQAPTGGTGGMAMPAGLGGAPMAGGVAPSGSKVGIQKKEDPFKDLLG